MKGIAWVGVSIGQMKVQRGSENPTTNAFFILVASRYAYSTYVFFFFFDRFFFLCVCVGLSASCSGRSNKAVL